jgi:pilus assembly protein Flp/PilA
VGNINSYERFILSTHLVKEPKMINIQRKVIAFLNDENGPTAVEYAVMVALIIVVSIAAITTLGTKVSSTFSTAEKKITTAS